MCQRGACYNVKIIIVFDKLRPPKTPTRTVCAVLTLRSVVLNMFYLQHRTFHVLSIREKSSFSLYCFSLSGRTSLLCDDVIHLFSRGPPHRPSSAADAAADSRSGNGDSCGKRRRSAARVLRVRGQPGRVSPPSKPAAEANVLTKWTCLQRKLESPKNKSKCSE